MRIILKTSDGKEDAQEIQIRPDEFLKIEPVRTLGEEEFSLLITTHTAGTGANENRATTAHLVKEKDILIENMSLNISY